MDKFESIRVFVQVVKAGSFAKAADRLGLSTTTTSRLLRELEESLGTRLLHRSTRRLSLTASGELLIDHYERMLEDLASVEALVGDGAALASGRLRVAVPHTFARTVLQPLLRDFASEYPLVSLDVVLSDTRSDLVGAGVDVAIRIALDLPLQLIAKRLTTVRIAVCASPAYLAEHGEPRVPTDLAAHSCLLYTGNDPPEDWHLDGPEGRVVQRVGGKVRANNGELLRACALAGDGIILQPTFLVGQDIKAGRLVRILRDYEPAPRGAYAIYAERRHLPAKVRAFIDYMAQALDGPPWWDGEAGANESGDTEGAR